MAGAAAAVSVLLVRWVGVYRGESRSRSRCMPPVCGWEGEVMYACARPLLLDVLRQVGCSAHCAAQSSI